MDSIKQPEPASHPSDSQLQPAEEPLTIRSPGDVLAYIPHALGEWPSESLVAVSIGRGRLGPTLRVSLPGQNPGGLGQYAGMVGDYVCSDSEAEGVVLALYTDAEWPAVDRPPHAHLLAAVGERLDGSGLPVLDAWIVGPTHWRTILCTDLTCCPWPGRSVEELRTGRIGAEMVYRGSAYGPTEIPEPLERLLPPAALSAELQRYREDPGRWWDPLAFTAALAAWDEVLGGAVAVGPERLRLLGVTLARPALRDAVIVAAAADASTAWRGSRATAGLRAAGAKAGPPAAPPALPGGVSAARAAVALDVWRRADREAQGLNGAAAEADPLGPSGPREDSLGGGADPAFGAVLLGHTAGPPDWGRVEQLERICQRLTEMEEPEVRAPALSLLAWVQWARGRGGRSMRYLERALSVDPDYRLAQLLRRFVDHGELSGWARRGDAAWRRPSAA
ncbi:DUF4192 family protein [Sinomonas mesophila]|uniref:DUF4192 family protein n=1 Tax=Sinomonas mesophila TaxID=1531955 RepID=UPI000984706C|nr:DUF4192 family protein [Sinomonas mesophila]